MGSPNERQRALRLANAYARAERYPAGRAVARQAALAEYDGKLRSKPTRSTPVVPLRDLSLPRL